jgi:GDP-L-fucose synthase
MNSSSSLSLKSFLENTDAKVFVAGHNGMVGSAICRQLGKHGFTNIVLANRSELDLTEQAAVRAFFEKEKPDYVFLAAAKVGGIHANSEYPADFIYQNLMIESNIIDAAYQHDVTRLLFLGSTCIYPKLAEQPMSETALLTGTLEPTNEPYALAKIAGIKLCESYNRQYACDFRSVMPTNLYGPEDNFHAHNSHVIPGMLKRFHQAKLDNDGSVEVWGSGKPMREFLHVDDMAAACIHVMNLSRSSYSSETTDMVSHINVGTGVDVTIGELAETIKQVVGFAGDIVFNTDMPDGAPRKLSNVGLLKRLGWQSSIDLASGLQDAYAWFLANDGQLRES